MSLAVTYFWIVYRVSLQHVEQLLLAGLFLIDEHLVVRKLSMLIFLDFVDYLRIARLAEQVIVQVRILLLQLIGTGQVEPSPGTYRLGDSLTTAFSQLWINRITVQGSGFRCAARSKLTFL